jgi:hypothetical protein
MALNKGGQQRGRQSDLVDPGGSTRPLQTAASQARAAGTAFPQPILARERQSGELVTLIAFGDIPGNSPSYLCVDDAGVSNWLAINDVQITDPRVLPLTPQVMAQIQETLQQNLQQQR